MSNTDKQTLLAMLMDSHATLLETVVNFDLEVTIHKDSGWRGREMLSHIGSWDREVVNALLAYAKGEEYLIPDYDEDKYNNQAANNQKSLSTEEIIEDWKQARIELLAALKMIPENKFPGDLLYPWGDERGNIYEFIKYFSDHDIEHKEEMENFTSG